MNLSEITITLSTQNAELSTYANLNAELSTYANLYMVIGSRDDEMVHDRITLQSLISILRGKSFTGALIFEEGKILFMDGSIKLVSYHNDCGEFVLGALYSLPLPPGLHVVELSGSQVKLWLKWHELLHGGEELYISPLPEIDKKSLRRFLDENGLTYLLVETREGV